ncbi:hypothetical protein Q7P37_003459 [Cladosporium fusiforme]
MHHLQTLPGELRNEIYHALLNSTLTLRLSKAGVLISPTLAHTNNLIRRELCSLLEHKRTPELEAQAVDFALQPLHTFLLTHPTKQTPTPTTTTIKLTLHLTSPGAEKAHYAALHAFLADSQSHAWSVGYRVKFDWTRYGLAEAAQCAREFAAEFMPGGVVAGSAGEGLWRALRKAREAEVGFSVS